MNRYRVFVSSVQSEFATERQVLMDYFRDDPLMKRFFDLFLFEGVPASDRRLDEVYMQEVDRADVYIGLFGWGYGSEDEEGVSPTEREFDRASELGVHRLVFVKGREDGARHPRMQGLIRRAQTDLVRRRFNSVMELKMAVYAALVEFLEERNAIYRGRFDAASCEGATVEDLDHEQMVQFIRTARRVRKFTMTEDVPPESFLEHLNLLSNGRPTNAAVLLFGKNPQRYMRTSEVKCAHFHGTQVAKPIPSYQVYEGTVFDMVDRAADFVLDRIDLSVGTRAESMQAPVSYEIPKEVVVEAIVNAVAHRDYTSNGSVQVMLFKDRLEVWNPGILPRELTLDKLRVPHRSVPANPLLAHGMYLVEYIERMGTGTLDMISRCAEAGLPEPEFAVDDGFVMIIRRRRRDQVLPVEQPSDVQAGTKPAASRAQWVADEGPVEGQANGERGPSWGQAGAKPGPGGETGARLDPKRQATAAALSVRDVGILQAAAAAPVPWKTLLAASGYSGRSGGFKRLIGGLVVDGLLEMTLPETPSSPAQQYRLTAKGREALAISGRRRGDRSSP